MGFNKSYIGHVKYYNSTEKCKLTNKNVPLQDQDTPLHMAAMKGHYKVCELLLKAKAEVNANDKASIMHM